VVTPYGTAYLGHCLLSYDTRLLQGLGHVLTRRHVYPPL
jgi:hypothetical protein